MMIFSSKLFWLSPASALLLLGCAGDPYSGYPAGHVRGYGGYPYYDSCYYGYRCLPWGGPVRPTWPEQRVPGRVAPMPEHSIPAPAPGVDRWH